ncbi:MAG: VanZ family protein [Bacteroidales bacterium]|jgi:VanZ family protein|nr:VanZ family protein [Bacteroidales bacterium]
MTVLIKLYRFSQRYILLTRILSVICCGVVVALCLMPSSELPDISFRFSDKLAHFGFYFGWSALLMSSLRRKSMPVAIVLVLILVAFSGGIELMQQYMGYGRSASWGDLAANSAGALVGTALVKYVDWKSGRAGELQLSEKQP